ncbi:hypothetical protein ACEWPM_018520 [Roseovarius sp. S4756]|uniref:hypothetical protein n=1 Tax=Roseovarius maritimus TaxID=3342637 RepID=UPI00372ABDC8
MQYLTFETYERNALENPGRHWQDYENRWAYYSRAVEVAKTIAPTSPRDVLEMGTMGASLVIGCDTIDFSKNKQWDFAGKEPDILHDARKVPWPVADKKYELFIALRVYQHLVPAQRACFNEAKRIAKNVLIVTPSVYGNGGGLDVTTFTDWNNGKPPSLSELVMGKTTYLYLWREEDYG